MNIRQSAQSLGRRGGLARARHLAPEQRKKIASQGGRAKALARHAARRVEDNFNFLEILETLKKAAHVHNS